MLFISFDSCTSQRLRVFDAEKTEIVLLYFSFESYHQRRIEEVRPKTETRIIRFVDEPIESLLYAFYSFVNGQTTFNRDYVFM